MTSTVTGVRPTSQESVTDGPAGSRATEHRRATPRSAGSQPTAARRALMAGAIVNLVRRAIVDPSELAIELEGAEPGHAPPARARAIIRGPDALARLLFPPSPDAFAEGYLRGDLELRGDVMAAVGAGETIDLRRLGPVGIRRLVRWGLELRRGAAPTPPLRRVAAIAGERHSRARDLAAVRFHYDVGNAFFSLWLDRRLAYSCAYFPEGTTPEDAPARLDGAQEAKLDLIAGKLRLGPGARLLDIGSGWGSLIGYAGERCGCEAIGITLSERQATEADARARTAGTFGRVRTLVRDYRDLADLGAFDAVASVGMFEHVGRANLPTYFAAAFDALRPGGLLLNHGIASAGMTGSSLGPDLRPTTSHFVDRYVFPDGELVPVDEAVGTARAAGFEVIDVQSLRPHYALTLGAWVRRLEARWSEAVAAAGEEVARTWRLYMSAARLGFERGDLDVCQLLLAKPAEGRAATLPLRPWW